MARILVIPMSFLKSILMYLFGMLFLVTICEEALSAELVDVDINSKMMESTFKIVGQSKKDSNMSTVGTTFTVCKPIKSMKGKCDPVLVTAAHVLEDIAGDDATVFLRKKNPDGTYKKVPFKLKIRNNGTDVFVKHKSADVVALYLTIPGVNEYAIHPLSVELFADDAIFNKYEIHPGDELLTLGYPLTVEANDAGFPILRGGKIASYPITPANKVKTFLIDLRVFPGNSGGPVYMNYLDRPYNLHFHPEEFIRYIAGLVSQSGHAPPEFNNEPLSIAVVVPAQFVLETVRMLPELGK